MSLKIVYAGTPPFAVPALSALAASRHEIGAVYTQPDRPAGRGRGIAASEVKLRALELGLPVHQPATLRTPESVAALAALAPDVVLVAAYGLIFPAALLAVPRLGCLNIHASLLPRWRGAAPVARAIEAGDREAGVCIMQMEPTLDTGPTYACAATPIGTGETTAALTARLAAMGAELVLGVLAALEEDRARAVPQPAAGVCYAAKLTKAEAPVDWRAPAEVIERRIRAFQPWPVAHTLWQGAALRLLEARVVTAAAPAAAGSILHGGADGIDVATGEGVLRLTRVQLAGRRPVTGAEFANAHGAALPGRQFGR